MSAEPSTIGSLRRRGLFLAMFVLAACDSDPTPIVPTAAAGGSSPGDSNKLGPNDRLGVTSSTLTGEYTLDGNGVLAFPLIGQRPRQWRDDKPAATGDRRQEKPLP